MRTLKYLGLALLFVCAFAGPAAAQSFGDWDDDREDFDRADDDRFDHVFVTFGSFDRDDDFFDHFFFFDGDFYFDDGFFDDQESESGDIETSPDTSTSSDQDVNQAAAASSP
jgi:hypothetical protein